LRKTNIKAEEKGNQRMESLMKVKLQRIMTWNKRYSNENNTWSL